MKHRGTPANTTKSSTHRTVTSPLIGASSTSRGAIVIAPGTKVLLAVLASVVVSAITSEVSRALIAGGGSGIVAKLVAKVDVATISYPPVL